jgi:hypothetical protein
VKYGRSCWIAPYSFSYLYVFEDGLFLMFGRRVTVMGSRIKDDGLRITDYGLRYMHWVERSN